MLAPHRESGAGLAANDTESAAGRLGRYPDADFSGAARDFDGGQDYARQMSPTDAPLMRSQGQSILTESPRGNVNGRVIIAEPAHQEQPDFDWYRLFTRILWLLLLVILPLVILRGVLQYLGGLPALLTFVGFLFLLRFVSPTNLFMVMQLSQRLNPAPQGAMELVPVRYFRVRQDDDSEVLVRVKGVFTHGNIGQDDLVSLWGAWRQGTFQAGRGYNHRSRSWVELRRSYSRIVFAITLVVVLSLSCWFYQPVCAVASKLHQLGVTR